MPPLHGRLLAPRRASPMRGAGKERRASGPREANRKAPKRVGQAGAGGKTNYRFGMVGQKLSSDMLRLSQDKPLKQNKMRFGQLVFQVVMKPAPTGGLDKFTLWRPSSPYVPFWFANLRFKVGARTSFTRDVCMLGIRTLSSVACSVPG